MTTQELLDRPAAARPQADGARRFIHLTYTLAITEWKLRFFDSALGYLWTLARPLMMFGVLYFVFSQIAKLSTIPHYPVYLLMGIVLFTFFQETTGTAVRCLVERESLLRKIRFPRLVVPFSVVLTALFNLGMNLVVLLLFMLVSGIFPKWSWLEFPILLVLLVAFAAGLALLLSVLFVRFRDLQPIWEVVSQMLFYGSPILYPITQFGDYADVVVLLSPLAAIVTQARHGLIDPDAPSVAEVAGSVPAVLIPVAICLGLLALGLYVFRRAEPHLAEDL